MDFESATIVPIYYPCLWLGEALLGKGHRDKEWLTNVFSSAPTEWLPKVKFFGVALKDIAIELWVGCIVVGGVLGVLSYFVTYWMVYSYRMRVWGQLIPPPNQKHPLLEALEGGETISSDDSPVVNDERSKT